MLATHFEFIETTIYKRLNHANFVHYFTKLNNSNKIEPVSIPEICLNDLTSGTFKTLTKNFTKPLIIRKFCHDCHAYKKWNLNFFQTKYHEKDRSFADFIQKFKEKIPIYLNNIASFFKHDPELIHDLPLDKIQIHTGVDLSKNPENLNVFYSNSDDNKISNLIASVHQKFYYNIRGKQEWNVIEPKYYKYLLGKVTNTASYYVSEMTIENQTLNKIPHRKIVIEEGDLIYIPPWYWYSITLEESSKIKNNIGCSMYFNNSIMASFMNNPYYTAIFLTHSFKTIKNN